MRKKVLFLSPSLAIGGAERVLVNLLKEIEPGRYDITLCLFSNRGDYFDELPSGINVTYIFKNHFLARTLTYLQRKFGFSILLKLIVRNKLKDCYDVGIATSDGTLTDVLLFLEDRIKMKISWVHSCYKSQKDLVKIFTPKKIASLLTKRYSRLNSLIFVSENSKTEFIDLFGIPAPLHTIYNVFDYKNIKTRANEEINEIFSNEITNIVAIGRLVEVKEFQKLIYAIKYLTTKGIQLKARIIGDGRQKVELKTLIDDLNLQNSIELLGNLKNPYPYLKLSDILVLTSSSEAFPTVLIEALALKVPIVATKCSGAVEISDNGKFALLTDHSIDDIASKLELMISDKQLRHKYSSLSAERLENFQPQKVLIKIFNILDN